RATGHLAHLAGEPGQEVVRAVAHRLQVIDADPVDAQAAHRAVAISHLQLERLAGAVGPLEREVERRGPLPPPVLSSPPSPPASYLSSPLFRFSSSFRPALPFILFFSFCPSLFL